MALDIHQGLPLTLRAPQAIVRHHTATRPTSQVDASTSASSPLSHASAAYRRDGRLVTLQAQVSHATHRAGCIVELLTIRLQKNRSLPNQHSPTRLGLSAPPHLQYKSLQVRHPSTQNRQC